METLSIWLRQLVICPLAPCCWPKMGWVALLRGDVVRAERLSVEATELAKDLGNRRVWAHALRLHGEALLRRGDHGAAATLDRALAVAEELGAPAEVSGVRCSQACLALENNRPDEARRLARDAMALSVLPHAMRRVSLAWVLGMAALLKGDLDAAEREFQADLEAAEAGQIVRHQANSLWGLARASADAGRLGKAAELHQRALALRHRIRDRLGRSHGEKPGPVSPCAAISTAGWSSGCGPIEPEQVEIWRLDVVVTVAELQPHGHHLGLLVVVDGTKVPSVAAERDRLGGPMLGQPPRLGPGRRESVHGNNATGETHLECRLDDGLAGLDGLADGVCNPGCAPTTGRSAPAHRSTTRPDPSPA